MKKIKSITIDWYTGTPKESGEYLTVRKSNRSEKTITSIDSFVKRTPKEIDKIIQNFGRCDDGWYSHLNLIESDWPIVAWSPVNNIKL